MDDEAQSLSFDKYIEYVKQFVITKEQFDKLKQQLKINNGRTVNKFIRNQVEREKVVMMQCLMLVSFAKR